MKKCHKIKKHRNASYFSGEVLEDGSTVHSCCSAYTTVAGCASLQVPMDTPHGELTENKGNKVSNAGHPSRNLTLNPQITCSPALWERETAFAFALPLSFPALPPACMQTEAHQCKNFDGEVTRRDLCMCAKQSWQCTTKYTRIFQRATNNQQAKAYCIVRGQCLM